MNLFESVKLAPPDAILGLTEAFNADTNPRKVNLTVGVFKDEQGNSPVLNTVRDAARRLIERQTTKTYLPMTGSPAYVKAVQDLVFGPQNEMVTTGRVVTVQTPGGTGGLRVAADFLRSNIGIRQVWVPRPTWPNHPSVFTAADLSISEYPYLDTETNSLNLEGMLTVLESIPPQDIVVFHGCCHNPTGIDPETEHWETIAKIVKARRLLPVVDFAYQGFGDGLVEDAAAIRAFSEYGVEFMVCSSFSKNFGLYRERVGALSIVTKNEDEAARVASQVKIVVRKNYSNPPAHGAEIVAEIWNDPELRQRWEIELGKMRDRLITARQDLVDHVRRTRLGNRLDFLTSQRGMFSMLGLPQEAVDRLRDIHAVYLVKGARINVAGITPDNVEYVAKAFEAVANAR